MNVRKNQCFKVIAEHLDKRGIPFRFHHCSKHPAVIVDVNPPLKFSFPGSTGDRRASLNVVRDLKRLLATRKIDHA